MKRIIFINRFFFPDHSATSQLLSDLAFALTTRGYEVHVLTSRQLYEQAGARLPSSEIVHGVKVHRLAGTRFGRLSLAGRAIDYLSFYTALCLALPKLARGGDIVVAMTDPPLLSLIAGPIARRKRSYVVNWLHDLYPEVALEVGTKFVTPQAANILKALRDKSLRAADCNVVIGTAMAARLAAMGVPAKTIKVLHNWADDRSLEPVHSSENPLKRTWNLEGKFVIGYSGNVGRVHDIDTVISAAELLSANSDIIFLCIGGGAQFEVLKQRVKQRSLSHLFRFMPYQNVDDLKYSLSVADVHWLSLKLRLEGLIFPSKFYGIAAVGRPIIAIASEQSDLAQLVQEHRCGFVVEPGDAKRLADVLRTLIAAPELCHKMGARARVMFRANFTREQAINAWCETLGDAT